MTRPIEAVWRRVLRRLGLEHTESYIAWMADTFPRPSKEA